MACCTCGIGSPEASALDRGVGVEFYVHVVRAGGKRARPMAATKLAQQQGILIRAVKHLNVIIGAVLVWLQLKLLKSLQCNI